MPLAYGREREISQETPRQYQNCSVSILILWICIFILETYEFCIERLCNDSSVTFVFSSSDELAGRLDEETELS